MSQTTPTDLTAILDVHFEEIQRQGQVLDQVVVILEKLGEKLDKHILASQANFTMVGSAINNLRQTISLERHRFEDLEARISTVRCIQDKDQFVMRPANGDASPK